MPTTTKKDLIDRIADETKYKRNDVRAIVQAFLDTVITELGDGNRLEFRDFGVFELRERAPRMAQNPRTLERVPVPARRTVKFKVDREWADRHHLFTCRRHRLDHRHHHAELFVRRVIIFVAFCDISRMGTFFLLVHPAIEHNLCTGGVLWLCPTSVL